MTNRTPRGIGHRQHHILQTMHQHHGYWPPHYRIRSDHAHLFVSLMHRGLITRAWLGHQYTYKLVRAPQ